MRELKIQRPGIALVRHQDIQHGHWLKCSVVTSSIGHRAVANFEQAFQKRPVLLTERKCDLAQHAA